MPQRHSKNNSDRQHYTYHEKMMAGLGSVVQRLSSDSQLPFGHCCLSLQPIEDAVVSPSGHMYDREAILEYILAKTKEIKKQTKLYNDDQERQRREMEEKAEDERQRQLQRFADTQTVDGVLKRKAEDMEPTSSYMESRKKLIDDRDADTKIAELRQVCPWVPMFTPEAKESAVKAPPKRPQSPMSGNPLKTSDLIPVNLEREETATGDRTRFICPVSRKTITNQQVKLIKSTGTIMIEEVYKSLAQPTMTCPITGKKFRESDVIDLARAVSSFAATGNVEAKKYRPNYN